MRLEDEEMRLEDEGYWIVKMNIPDNLMSELIVLLRLMQEVGTHGIGRGRNAQNPTAKQPRVTRSHANTQSKDM